MNSADYIQKINDILIDNIKFTKIRRDPTEDIKASLDVESLFSNVSVNDTINIILKHVYHHGALPKPNIPKAIMKRLLKICTTECLFYSSTGEIYVQKKE